MTAYTVERMKGLAGHTYHVTADTARQAIESIASGEELGAWEWDEAMCNSRFAALCNPDTTSEYYGDYWLAFPTNTTESIVS